MIAFFTRRETTTCLIVLREKNSWMTSFFGIHSYTSLSLTILPPLPLPLRPPPPKKRREKLSSNEIRLDYEMQISDLGRTNPALFITRLNADSTDAHGARVEGGGQIRYPRHFGRGGLHPNRKSMAKWVHRLPAQTFREDWRGDRAGRPLANHIFNYCRRDTAISAG